MLLWTSENQIKEYINFQRQRAMTVLMLLGVGGVPSNPKDLFITPLDHISMYTHVLNLICSDSKKSPT
jgi:hypothetical protein